MGINSSSYKYGVDTPVVKEDGEPISSQETVYSFEDEKGLVGEKIPWEVIKDLAAVLRRRSLRVGTQGKDLVITFLPEMRDRNSSYPHHRKEQGPFIIGKKTKKSIGLFGLSEIKSRNKSVLQRDEDEEVRRLLEDTLGVLNKYIEVSGESLIGNDVLDQQIIAYNQYGLETYETTLSIDESIEADQSKSINVAKMISKYRADDYSLYFYKGKVVGKLKSRLRVKVGDQEFKNPSNNYTQFVELPFSVNLRAAGKYLIDGDKTFLPYSDGYGYGFEEKEGLAGKDIIYVGEEMYSIEGEYYIGDENIFDKVSLSGQSLVSGTIVSEVIESHDYYKIFTDVGVYRYYKEVSSNGLMEGVVIPNELSENISSMGFKQKIQRCLSLMPPKTRLSLVAMGIGGVDISKLLHEHEGFNRYYTFLETVSDLYQNTLFEFDVNDTIQGDDFIESRLEKLTISEFYDIVKYLVYTGSQDYDNGINLQQQLKLTTYEKDSEKYSKQYSLVSKIAEKIYNYEGDIPRTTFFRKATGYQPIHGAYLITQDRLIKTFGFRSEEFSVLSQNHSFRCLLVKNYNSGNEGEVPTLLKSGNEYNIAMPICYEDVFSNPNKKQQGFIDVLMQEMTHAFEYSDEIGSEIPNLMTKDKYLVIGRFFGCLQKVIEKRSNLTSSYRSSGYKQMYTLYDKVIRGILGEDIFNELADEMQTIRGFSMEKLEGILSKKLKGKNMTLEEFIDKLSKEYYQGVKALQR